MRDILVVVVLLGLIPICLRRPVFAAAVYIAISVGSAYRLAYGFASDQPWALLYALVLFVSLLFSKEHSIWKGVMRWLPFFPFLVWVTFSTIVALDPLVSYERFYEFMKIQVGLILVFATVRSIKDAVLIYAAYTASITFHGVKAALFALKAAGPVTIQGPPGTVIADNNHFALALISCIPLMIYFASRARHSFVRIAYWGMVAGNALTVLASMSRGGVLALGATAFFVLIRSRNRFKIFITLIPILALAFALMPPEFYERISTIGSYDQDLSVKGRFEAWETAFNVANSRLTGAGFEFYKNASVWEIFSPPEAIPRAAHSIYFQLLGDQGFIGLLLYLFSIGWILYARRLSSVKLTLPDFRDFVDLRRAGVLSIVSVMIGGASLSLAYWEGFLLLVGMISCLDNLVIPPKFRRAEK